MRDQYQPEDREVLLNSFGDTKRIIFRLEDLQEQLELDSDLQQAVQHTIFKAHDLLVSLRAHLVD